MPPPRIGINVLREKLRVTVISASLTALGGAIYGQYFMYLNPDTVSGIAVSLQIVFAVIAGGVYSMLGPTVGALLTLSLTEGCASGSAPISSVPPTRSTASCSFSASSSCRKASSARSERVRFRRAAGQGGSGGVTAVAITAAIRRPSSAAQ